MFRNILIIISLIAFSNYSLAATPSQNSTFQQYYDSGAYFKEIDQKLLEAKDYLARQLQVKRQQPLSIVLDIDETALSNYLNLKRLMFTQNPQALAAAYLMADAPALPAILNLYQFAIQNQIAVFFVSERPASPEITVMTVKNLRTAGFLQWTELILRPLDKDDLSVEAFKTQARQQIIAKGYDIILNVGDQLVDLNGGYAEVKIKLPNPFYTVS